MKILNIFTITLIISMNISQYCFAQYASFQGLGDFQGGAFESAAQKVSADGSVVIGYGTTNSGQQSFRWTQNTGMVSLGNVADGSLKSNWANNISDDGAVIVGSGDPGSGWNGYMGFRWIASSGMEKFGSLNGSTRYEAFSVSADGSVIVGDGGLQAFRAEQSGTIEGLGVLPGRARSRAVDVSADGSVVVGSSYTVAWEQEQAFRWTRNEGIIGLGFLPGSNYSFPNAVSPDGLVIVGTSSSTSGYPAFRWTKAGGMVNIGYLPGRTTAHPFDVSYNGKIIVGGSFNGPTDSRAFIWDSTHGIRDLQNVLQSEYGLNLTGWVLNTAFGISHDGNVIVGYGKNTSGQMEAFRVVLDTRLTDVNKNESSIPNNFLLNQNYPNPFNPSTVISYQLAAGNNVRLKIYDTLGREIKSLVDSFQNAGEHSLIWNATDNSNNHVSSGIYFYKMESNGMSFLKKMILVR
jgi:probable HAF family extracellular repeat protein